MDLVRIIEKVFDRIATKHIQAKITAVDEAAATCEAEPLAGGPQLLEVKLNNANSTNIGLAPVPKIGSVVTVTVLRNGAAFVALFGELEKMIVTAPAFQFNDGSHGGLIKINDLVSKLNAVESDLNSLKTTFSTTWVPVPSDGGAALKTAATTWAGQTITETTAVDIENETVKHG